LWTWVPYIDMKTSPDGALSLLRSKVARRILAIFMLCALLPVCVLGGLSLWQVSRKLENETYQAVQHASKNAGMSVLEALSIAHSELEAMAETQALPEGSRRSVRRMGETQHEARLIGLTFYDKKGGFNVLFGQPNPRPVLTDPMRAHLASGKALLFVRTDDAKTRIYMAARTATHGHKGGLLVGEVNEAYLWETAQRSLPAGMQVSLLLDSMQVLFSPLQLPQQVLATRTQGPLGHHTGQFEWRGETETYLSGYWTTNLRTQYLTDDWIVMASRSQSEAFSSLQRFTRIFLLFLLLMLMIILFLSLVQIRRSLVPLDRLKEGTQRVASGDLESLVRVESGDEFEELAHAFNSMSGHLRKQFHNLNSMGHMVRTILTSLDRARITDSVLDDFLGVVPCDWASLLLLKSERQGEADVCYIDNTREDSSQRFQFSCSLSMKQILLLERTADSIVEGPDGNFSSLTAPLAERGACFFALIPVRSSHRVTGALTLAYRGQPAAFREDLARGRQLADHIAAAIFNADLLNDLAELNVGTLTALARAVDANSHWTAGHSERVTALSLNVGRPMGLSKKELDVLNRAGLLHDLGKIGVPASILDKPGKLTDEEWVIIKEHPGKGALILEPIPAFREAVPLVAQHHERFDGSGYPLGLAGTNISLGARILAVADVYDALISDRPYRAGWSLPDVIQFINSKAGLDFDPEVVRAFRSLKLDNKGADNFDTTHYGGEILRVSR
jgi:HD-GYP domain-containing protein (c-di-GMP phosphodiesterase class II)/HAMP domain-containing protein